jgi:MFS family permease
MRFNLPNQILTVLCLMYFVLYVDRVNIATLAPRMTVDLGLSNIAFGLAVSAFAYPYAIFQLIGGWVTDRLGPYRTLLISGVIVCAATILTGFVGGLGALLVARLALGIGEGPTFPAATRAMAVHLPSYRWGIGQGAVHAAARIGNAAAPPLIVALLAYVSWRGSYVVVGLLSLIWVALWLWIYRDDPRERDGALPERERNVPWLKLARRMAPVTAVDFCYGWTLWAFLTWLPLFFFRSFQLNLRDAAIFASGVLLGGVLGDAVGGSISDLLHRYTGSLQIARRNLIIAGLLGAFVALIPVVLSHDLVIVAGSLCVACFFSELVVAPIWAVPMDIAPAFAGSASGMMNFGFGVAGIVSPVIFGALVDSAHSWSAPFYGSLILLLVGAGLSFFMHPERAFEE